MQMKVSGISIFFFAFMALTVLITYWAAKRTTTPEQFLRPMGISQLGKMAGRSQGISYRLPHSSASPASSPRTVSMD